MKTKVFQNKKIYNKIIDPTCINSNYAYPGLT